MCIYKNKLDSILIVKNFQKVSLVFIRLSLTISPIIKIVKKVILLHKLNIANKAKKKIHGHFILYF